MQRPTEKLSVKKSKDQDFPISLVQNTKEILCYASAICNSQVINILV